MRNSVLPLLRNSYSRSRIFWTGALRQVEPSLAGKGSRAQPVTHWHCVLLERCMVSPAQAARGRLCAIYPPNPDVLPDALRTCLAETLRQHDDFILPWLQFAPQTNEVGRSVALYAGLMEVTRRMRLPLAVYEIGSSAGLNLVLDHYRYDFGGSIFGASDAGLTLCPEWEGPIPEPAHPEIVTRRGCDIAPLRIVEAPDRARLEAYVWPDQIERHQRLAAAIDIFIKDPPEIDAADAPDWVRKWIRPERLENRTTVLMHSLTFTYLARAAKEAIRSHMESVGAMATKSASLAWLAYELDAANKPVLTVRLWPTGEQVVLAEGHPHCRHMIALF